MFLEDGKMVGCVGNFGLADSSLSLLLIAESLPKIMPQRPSGTSRSDSSNLGSSRSVPGMSLVRWPHAKYLEQVQRMPQASPVLDGVPSTTLKPLKL